MRSLSAIGVLLAVASLCRGEYSPSRDEIIAMQKKGFEGRKPEEIARFLAHPDETTQKAAVAALADNPETAMPLVEKLITDTNPWIRAGAVDVMAEIVRRAEKGKEPSATDELAGHSRTEAPFRLPDKNTQEELVATRLVEVHLAEESDSQVLFSICKLLSNAPFDSSLRNSFIGRSANSGHPGVRHEALKACFADKHNPHELIRAAVTVLHRSDGAISQETLVVTRAFLRAAMTGPTKEAIPAVASHLLHKVNDTDPPFRNRSWATAVSHELTVLEKHWDVAIEQSPDVVPALCRAFVRLPYNEQSMYRGARLRERTLALLERCTPNSAKIIRACAKSEKEWLETVTDSELMLVASCLSSQEISVDDLREKCGASVTHLNVLAGRLTETEH